MNQLVHLKSTIAPSVTGPIRCRPLWRCLLLVPLVLGCFGLVSSTTAPRASAIQKNLTLTFEERVAYQRAIEDVYWRHRIWPEERPGPKPSLDTVMSRAQLETKVEGYLRNSQAVQDYRQRPITSEQLQAEMDRMAQHTRQPEMLRELFAALGNDPFVIAECLARPVLSERMVAKFDADDKEPLDSSRARAENQMPKLMAAASANYTLPTISDAPDGCIDNTWTATSTTNAPTARSGHTAVWTGSEMIVWGENSNTGGRYNPSTDSWTATSTTNAPTARSQHTAVWTGSEMIVWGGYTFPTGDLNTGGRYNPGTDSWTATSTTNAPSIRRGHTAVWTGSEMIVWGGIHSILVSRVLNTGGTYNPGTDSWTATSTTNAPAARSVHTAVWTNNQMIVWGGADGGLVFNSGGRYNPGRDSWTATSITNAPSARGRHTAVWTGSEMIVWGGTLIGSDLNTGGRYNPGTNSWRATSTAGAPSGRRFHTAVWTENEMIVWGGEVIGGNFLNTGGRYNPGTNTWTATSITNAPFGRAEHTAVWTDSEMIVWGGIYFDGLNDVSSNTGGRYCAQAGAPTPSPTPVLHAAFYYPWFPDAWGNLSDPFTNYHPSLGYYSSDDASVIANHVDAMIYAHLDAGISSWWGQGENSENTRFPAQLAAASGKPFKWTLYYEKEGYGDPTVSELTADLNYIKSRYANNSSYLTRNGKPVIFVYGDATDGCGMADRWKQANAAVGNTFYVVLKVFGGYTSCVSQPDGWHQYGPAGAEDDQPGYSFMISPGFWKKGEPAPRLARDLNRWRTNIIDMMNSNEPLQLVETFNEWGEGTAVESAQEWSSSSGYGTHLDALHNLLPPTLAARAAVVDFNGDGHLDYVVQNAATRQTALWYLNNNVFISGAYGPTLATGWGLRSVADFNRDTHPDYALFAPRTDQTAIWYLSGPTYIGSAYGPTLPSGWELVATGDFNGDGKPDHVLYKASNRQTAIWYMNNAVFVSGAYSPTLPAGWSLVSVADFNRDGHPDYTLFNPSTRQTAIWYLSGVRVLSGAYGPTLPSGWELVATGDFNGDGKPDYVLYEASTRQTAIWYMNNAVFVSGAYGPSLPVGWSLVAP